MPVDKNWLVWISQCSQAPEPHTNIKTPAVHKHTLLQHSALKTVSHSERQTDRQTEKEKGQTSSNPATTDHFRCSVKCCISLCVYACARVCVCEPSRAVTVMSCTGSVHPSKQVNPISNSNTPPHTHSSATETRSSAGREEWSEGWMDGRMDEQKIENRGCRIGQIQIEVMQTESKVFTQVGHSSVSNLSPFCCMKCTE